MFEHIRDVWEDICSRLNSKPYKPYKPIEWDEWKDNPHKEITIKPDYWNLDQSVIEFCVKVMEGYIWACEAPAHGGQEAAWAHHPELQEVKNLLYQMTWLKEKKEFWPGEDAMISMALIDFARLVPRMWD